MAVVPSQREDGWLFANGALRWRFDADADIRMAIHTQVYPSVEEGGVRFRGLAASVLSGSREFELGFGEEFCPFEREACDVQLYPATEEPAVTDGDIIIRQIQTAADGVPTMAVFEEGRARVIRFHGAP